MSRLQNRNTKWRLSRIVFDTALEVFYSNPKFALFLSCKNCQVDQFASWQPNRNAMAIDAFSIPLSESAF